jgi:Sulfotransferase family
MSNLVFVSGDYCSGSTLVSTLFRKSGQYYCLYEPLHARLPEFLIWRPDPRPRDHHFFAKDNYAEMARFDRIADLHSSKWGSCSLYLPPGAEADDLYRYLSYLIGSSFGRYPRVMLKENCIAFRLGWIRATFPSAKIVHIYRDAESQWMSNVRRAQEFFRKEDVGQTTVSYNGFNVATFCEDLKSTFPELEAGNFSSGYERFHKLWELSYRENQKYADIAVNYRDLTRDFEPTWTRVWSLIGAPPIDVGTLKQYVVPPEKQRDFVKDQSQMANYIQAIIDRFGFRYARARLRARNTLHKRRAQKVRRTAPHT